MWIDAAASVDARRDNEDTGICMANQGRAMLPATYQRVGLPTQAICLPTRDEPRYPPIDWVMQLTYLRTSSAPSLSRFHPAKQEGEKGSTGRLLRAPDPQDGGDVRLAR